MKHSTPKRSALPAYTSTPILNAVRAMHAEQDKHDLARGFDPYNTLSRREADIAAVSAAQVREANEILACFDSTLEVLP